MINVRVQVNCTSIQQHLLSKHPNESNYLIDMRSMYNIKILKLIFVASDIRIEANLKLIFVASDIRIEVNLDFFLFK